MVRYWMSEQDLGAFGSLDGDAGYDAYPLLVELVNGKKESAL